MNFVSSKVVPEKSSKILTQRFVKDLGDVRRSLLLDQIESVSKQDYVKVLTGLGFTTNMAPSGDEPSITEKLIETLWKDILKSSDDKETVNFT